MYALNRDFWNITDQQIFVSLAQLLVLWPATGSAVCKFYFKTPCSQHALRRRYNGAFIEHTETGSAHQQTRKWSVMCDNFHRFGMWPPGAVFGCAEQMMRLLAHLEHTGAWDRQGSLFCERLKGKICSSCRFFPPHGGGRRCEMKYQREAVCVCLPVCAILSVCDKPTAKH